MNAMVETPGRNQVVKYFHLLIRSPGLNCRGIAKVTLGEGPVDLLSITMAWRFSVCVSHQT